MKRQNATLFLPIIISRLSIMQKFCVVKVLMFSIFFAEDRGFTIRLLTAKRQCRLITSLPRRRF